MGSFPWIRLVNLVFCIAILILGVIKYRKTDVKAYLYVGLGFTMYAISHAFNIFGIAGNPGITETLIGVRPIGYILVIIGMAV